MTAQLAPINAFPPQLVMDLALGVEDIPTILERYSLTDAEYEYLTCHPAFRSQLAVAQKTILEEGLSFKAKAKVLAETHLQTMDEMLNDSMTPPATKLGVFQSLAKLGGLEPKPQSTDGPSTPTFALQININ